MFPQCFTQSLARASSDQPGARDLLLPVGTIPPPPPALYSFPRVYCSCAWLRQCGLIKVWSPPSPRRRPRVIPIYCASAATCPKKAHDDTAGPERGAGPRLPGSRALARHDRPLGAEPDAQSVRCRPGPGGARAQQNRHLRRRGSGAAGGSRHLSNLPL